MKPMISFIKKEFIAQLRSKKVMILALVFAFIGITNPIIAKLTPWILKIASDTLEGSGISIGEIEVTALDSWLQFFSNLSIVLIVFVVLQSNIFTKEYSKGTLILVLTKGFERVKVVISKLFVMIVLWTICYLICFASTYLINIFLWDNSLAKSLVFAVFIWWFFGVFVLFLITLFSCMFNSNIGVLGLTGGVVLVLYVVSFITKVKRFIPMILTEGANIVYGLQKPSYYLIALCITLLLMALSLLLSIINFNKKKL